jgi:hypothetical protein
MLADRSPPAQARVASASTVTPALAAALMAGPSHRNQEQLFDVQSWLQHKSSLGEPLLQHLKAKTLAALARASLEPLTLTPFEMGTCDAEFRSTVCKLQLHTNTRFLACHASLFLAPSSLLSRLALDVRLLAGLWALEHVVSKRGRLGPTAVAAHTDAPASQLE